MTQFKDSSDAQRLAFKIDRATSKMTADEKDIFLADIEDAIDGVIEDYA